MFKTFNKAGTRRPVGPFNELIAIFQLEISQIEPKKKQKFQNFSILSYPGIFLKFSTEFVDWNVEKVHTEKRCQVVYCQVGLVKRKMLFSQMNNLAD